MAHVRAQHVWPVGPGVQGLRGISSHWPDIQRRTVFEVCRLRSAPDVTLYSQAKYSTIMSGSRIAWPAGWKGRALRGPRSRLSHSLWRALSPASPRALAYCRRRTLHFSRGTFLQLRRGRTRGRCYRRPCLLGKLVASAARTTPVLEPKQNDGSGIAGSSW
mgnify:CR=1 FL=1